MNRRWENPTIVVLTDRNDLDDHIFGTFARCRDLLRQPPVQAENRAVLRIRRSVSSGGVVFTTIQKFFPEEKGGRHPLLSNRRNIVVIADEAHRSQYDFIDASPAIWGWNRQGISSRLARPANKRRRGATIDGFETWVSRRLRAQETV